MLDGQIPTVNNLELTLQILFHIPAIEHFVITVRFTVIPQRGVVKHVY